ncbi:MAG TPA: metalloregulator ArsR/SmtB family transcription factor [Solirubrobacteraceae bacterium]|nr:metalloregulator ArsR/SmtB family transcription factor [Solirubrobacteraceae bacterium]
MEEAALDERLRALAHTVRRRLVAACVAEPQPAGRLVELTGLAPASVSEHLKVLRKTGLLVLERRGRHRYYAANLGLVRQTAAALLADIDARSPAPPTSFPVP